MSDEFNLEEENLNENNLEYEDTEEIPYGVKKLNWGAFLWPFIWGLFNVKLTRVLVIVVLNLLVLAPVFFIFSGLGNDPSNVPFAMLSVGLMCLAPVINLIIMIVFLIKGNSWAWKDKKWESVDQFVAVQKKWTLGVLICWLLSMVASALIPLILGATVLSFVGKNLSTNFAQQNMGQGPSVEGTVQDFNNSYSSDGLQDLSNNNLNPSSYQAENTVSVGGENVDVPQSHKAVTGQNNDVVRDSVGVQRKPINNKDIIDNKDKVVITIGGHGRENPFKPFYDQAFSGDFPPPDDVFNIDESAKKLLSIKVAGILYDPYNPTNASAIVNASGSDYMVKKGDIVAGFSILGINKTRVSLKYGSNTYNAGIGETVQAELKNNSGIDNINKKFAGNTR